MNYTHNDLIRARRQAGSALVISMVMLVVLTLIVISIIKATNVNSRVAGNMQLQKEAEAAAQQAVETVIATPFYAAPAATSVAVDINGDGSNEYAVAVAQPTCVSQKTIKLADLDLSNAEDVKCSLGGAARNTGIIGGAVSGDSLCANALWDISATATDANAATTAKTHQGVSVRVDQGSAC
jgi:Tfp pilus assembly protein PilX